METVGAGWRYACDTDFYHEHDFALEEALRRASICPELHDFALEEALRRASICPEFCTRVLLSDLKGGASPIWVSRRDPDQDPDIAAASPGPFDPA